MRNGRSLPIGLALVAGFIAFSAWAQDVNRCIDRCFGSYPANQLRDMCVQRCTSSSSSSAPADQYGAIAFDPQSAYWGVAYGKPSAAAAERAAMKRCREQGSSGCEIAISYENACGAVATVRAKARYAVAQADTSDKAQDEAWEKCKSEIGGDCHDWAFSCAWNTH